MTVLIVVAVVTQRALAVLVQIVPRWPNQIVLQLAVHTTVTIHRAMEILAVVVGDVLQVKSKIAMATAALKVGSQMGIAMTVHTNGMVWQSSSIVMNLTATVATALIVMAVANQPALAVLEQVVPRWPKQTVLQLVARTTVTIRPVTATHVMGGEAAKQVGQRIAKALASQMLSMKHGLVIAIATMARTSQPIMVAMNAPLVLRYGWTVMILIATVATVNVILPIQLARAVLELIASNQQNQNALVMVVNGKAIIRLAN
jgi:hypothetical protein